MNKQIQDAIDQLMSTTEYERDEITDLYILTDRDIIIALTSIEPYLIEES